MVAHVVVIAAALLAPSTIRSTRRGIETGYGKPGYNPNKMICVSRDVTGSRLQAVRECHTAQQWEDQKMQETVGLASKQHNGDAGGVPIPMGGRDTPW
jgi:hypothetical protein